MKRLILCGSPRVDGRSAALAEEIFEACIAECPEDEAKIITVATTPVSGCVGCDACATAGEWMISADQLDQFKNLDEYESPCAIKDGMADVYRALDVSDELIVVCPVYFAGAPSQFKALLDRLQPYFWTAARQQPKRPAVLHVVGEGGDPHGYDPLVGSLQSALACAGYELQCIMDWVGKIDEDGEIIAEADQYVLDLAVVDDAEEIYEDGIVVWDDDDEDYVPAREIAYDEDEFFSEDAAPVAMPAEKKFAKKAPERGGAKGDASKGAKGGPKQGNSKQGGSKGDRGQQKNGRAKLSLNGQKGKNTRNSQAQQSSKRAGAQANKGKRTGGAKGARRG